jgi:hypothetical protein
MTSTFGPRRHSPSTSEHFDAKRKAPEKALADMEIGGSGEIRTHGGHKPSAVFKTAALNHSATLPNWATSQALGGFGFGRSLCELNAYPALACTARSPPSRASCQDRCLKPLGTLPVCCCPATGNGYQCPTRAAAILSQAGQSSCMCCPGNKTSV